MVAKESAGEAGFARRVFEVDRGGADGFEKALQVVQLLLQLLASCAFGPSEHSNVQDAVLLWLDMNASSRTRVEY